MTANELREKFLKFFESKGHKIIPSASLVPEHDPSVLFTTAGMHPLVPYLMGQKHPEGKRLANSQKCVRTSDIDEVGDNRHLTFFEMLGNWSLGDYFKEDAIKWSWEFLTGKEWLGLDPQRIYVTVFKGEGEIYRDDESIKIWQEVYRNSGIEAEVAGEDEIISGNIRIIPLGKDDNFWISGQTGPCGPDTEMFYDTQEGKAEGRFSELVDSFRLMEIWNDVFMEFNKKDDGSIEKLAQQNVDTGMGLERTISVINGKADSFDNELFYPIFKKFEEISGKKYENENIRPFRVVADHIKAAVFLVADGVAPDKTGRGYVLRRLIREAMHQMGNLSIGKGNLVNLVDSVIEPYKNIYSNLADYAEKIKAEIKNEEDRIEKSIQEGLRAFRNLEKKKPEDEPITGEEAAYLYQTCSLSVENTKGLAREYGRKISDDFDEVAKQKMKEHQDLSRTASAGMFKGGLADVSEETVKYHTAAHLMLAALRKVLGEHVFQKGSNITAERLRFDFSHPQKMTPDEIGWVEKMVNEKIAQDLPVQMEEMTLEEAKEKGAMGVFESKYGERVKVYSVGPSPEAGSESPFSREICGGPHVEKTGKLGKFKIIKEESAGAGIRRIKARLE